MKVAEIFSLGGHYGGGRNGGYGGYGHGSYHGGSYRGGYYGHRSGELLSIRLGVGGRY